MLTKFSRFIVEWEGPEALEEPAPAANPTSSQSSKPIPEPQQKDGSGLKEEPEEAEESPDDDSGDDYVADTAKSKGKVSLCATLISFKSDLRATTQRRAHQLSIISDPESGSDEDMKKAPKRLRRGSAVTIKEVKVPKEKSPGPSQAKRRPSTSSPSVPPKRKHSESTTGEDATRKYCTTKLQEVFSQIFTRYPFLPGEEIPVDETPEPKKKEQDLTDEEKEIVGIKGKAFASDLEQCVFDLYAEPDKHGKPAAGGKYK